MAYAALGFISRRSGYGGISNLVCGRGGGCVSRSSSSVESVSTGRMSPWLTLPPASEDGSMVYKFFSLAENRVLSFNWSDGAENCSDFNPNDKDAKLVGSSKGWLGLMNSRTRQMDLINPLTRRHLKLPSLEPLGDYVSASKIILSSSPDEEGEEGEFRALITYGEEDREDLMAFCCPGRSAAEWTPIGREFYYAFGSFAYSRRQKLFLCSNADQELQAWDLGDPLSPKMMTWTDLPFLRKGDRPRVLLGSDHEDMDFVSYNDFLVLDEDTNDLFFVRQFWKFFDDGDFKTITFDVHKYDPKSGTFIYMERGSLDGLSLFIGTDTNGFALSADEFPELKPNSIYFALNDAYFDSDNTVGGIDVGIFSYQDATVAPCSGVPSFELPTFRWFTPN